MTAGSATTVLAIGPSVDRQARGSIGEVYQVELPPNLSALNWLGGVVGIRYRDVTSQAVIKILRPKFIEDEHERVIRSLAVEARALAMLQGSHQVTPLLGYGTLEPGVTPGPGMAPGQLCQSLDEFDEAVASAAQTKRLPFLLLGNVPFEWTLLDPFVARLYEPGCMPEFRFGEAIQVAIALLRFLDRARAELGIYHSDMKLEHVAWREGCLIVIDWNWARLEPPGLQEGILYEDLRRLFIRVLYPLLTGKDIDGNDPTALWGRVGEPDVTLDDETGLLPLTNVDRLGDERLRRWLSRGFAPPGQGFPTHRAAADELAAWLTETAQDQPLWSRLDRMSLRASELTSEIQNLIDDAWQLRETWKSQPGAHDQQFGKELARLVRGLNRLRAARPVAVTRLYRTRDDALPWGGADA